MNTLNMDYMVNRVSLLGKKRKRKDEDPEYKDEEKITKFFKKENGEKIKTEPKEGNNSEKISDSNNIKREIRASQELAISREDVTEDKLSGPTLPRNFPKIEFDSDVEEQELIRKPKKKGISSLDNSADSIDVMKISSDSLTNKPANDNIIDVNMKDEDIGFEISEEERRIQRDILASAALKRISTNQPYQNVKIEPKNHNVNIINASNSNNNNVQLNKTTTILPKKEKILTEDCPICLKKISGTEVEITIHVEKCLTGDAATPEKNNKQSTKVKEERQKSRETKFQLGDNLVDCDDDVVVLD